MNERITPPNKNQPKKEVKQRVIYGPDGKRIGIVTSIPNRDYEFPEQNENEPETNSGREEKNG